MKLYFSVNCHFFTNESCYTSHFIGNFKMIKILRRWNNIIRIGHNSIKLDVRAITVEKYCEISVIKWNFL